MIIDLADIFIKQKELDLTIQAKRQTTYQLTLNEIKLALIVELAELANEVRSFKFWSYKPPSSKEIILEEYVDGLHFISSFAIIYQLPANFTLPDNIRVLDKAQITIKFNELLNLLSKLRFEHKLHCNKRIVKKWFRQYLILAYHLGFNFADVHRVYFEKNKVNFDRQANNY